ncbi:hypothetical protein [Streptomyces lasiicapitis]|uniref:hypothetical protein n=1 Tax=Streptomyces lasiicapitis TaxID=1923961 RepID=UPI003651E181
MKSVSRVVVAVSVAAALGLTAACSSGGDGDGGDGGRDGGKSSTSQAKPKGPGGGASGGGGSEAGGSGGSGGSDGSGGESPAAKKLTASALAKGDLDRYDYDVLAKEQSKLEAASDGAPANPSACRPLSDMLAAATPPGAKAHLGRTAATKSNRDSASTDIELFAYADSGAARKALKELRAAAKSKRCETFRAGNMRYSGVAPLPAPDKGDESVAYKLGSRQDEYVKRRTVVVVRDGSTLLSFAATNFYDPAGVAGDEESRDSGGLDSPGPDKADDAPKVPPVLIDAQLSKMK